MRYTAITSVSRFLENEVEPECTRRDSYSTRILQKEIELEEDRIFSNCFCDLGHRI